MNVSSVLLIYVSCLLAFSLADDIKPNHKRILKLKNVNYNRTAGKPKSTKKAQQHQTIFVLTNPVIYPQKLFSPKPTEQAIRQPPARPTPASQFDFLNFDAYILKPRNINYTAVLTTANGKAQDKQSGESPEPTANYPSHEFLDFPRAEALIQTTVPTELETVAYETTTQHTQKPVVRVETTTAKINPLIPLGLAYFDSLRKYRKAFESLRKRERTKKPRTRTTVAPTTTTTTTKTETTTTEFTPSDTEEPYYETTTGKEYEYVATPNFDEDLYEEPNFESYRYKPRYHHHHNYYDDETERNQFETSTRSFDYDRLERDDNHYESTETVATTTARPPNSRRRKPTNKNVHSSHVKSNYLYDRHIDYPQEEESRRVFSVARPDAQKDKRSARNKSQAIGSKEGTTDRRSDGTRRSERTEVVKKHKNTIPMQRHYFQYANAINDGAYNAGVGKGNQNHYIEQHELSVPKNGTFQKRVRWNDKRGGFGELYYDLNHH